MVVKSFVKLPLTVALAGVLVACTSAYYSTGPVGLGKPVTENQIKAWNIDIGPSGAGLPAGSGTAEQVKLFISKNVHPVMVIRGRVELLIDWLVEASLIQISQSRQ